MIIIRNKLTNSVWIYRKINDEMYVSFNFNSNRPDGGYTHQSEQSVNYTEVRQGVQDHEEIVYDSGEE